MISHLGSMIPVVNGILMARRFQGKAGHVGATCLGEGGTSTGAFHEGINQAAVEKLPLVLVVANNHYAYSTPSSKQFACRSLLEKAAGYGVTGHTADGTSLLDCLEVVGQAVHRARVGEGPQLVVARLLRLCGHGEHDDASYIDPRLKASAVGKDCMKVAETQLFDRKWLTREMLETWRQEIHDEIEQSVATVQREHAPDPFREKWEALSSRHLGEFSAAQ